MLKVEILNWEAFNPRKTTKRSSWFRFQHDYFESPNFFDFNAEETMVWLYLLCAKSKQHHVHNEPPYFVVNPAHLQHSRNVSVEVFKKVLMRLEQLQIVTFSQVPTRTRKSRPGTLRDETRRDVTAKREPDGSADTSLLDYQKILERYPKQGPDPLGEKRLKSKIKTVERYNQMMHAIDRYREFLVREKYEPKFVKRLRNFMLEWESWVEPLGTPPTGAAPPVQGKMVPGAAEIIARFRGETDAK